jgi:hypothetical protein
MNQSNTLAEREKLRQDLSKVTNPNHLAILAGVYQSTILKALQGLRIERESERRIRQALTSMELNYKFTELQHEILFEVSGSTDALMAYLSTNGKVDLSIGLMSSDLLRLTHIVPVGSRYQYRPTEPRDDYKWLTVKFENDHVLTQYIFELQDTIQGAVEIR